MCHCGGQYHDSELIEIVSRTHKCDIFFDKRSHNFYSSTTASKEIFFHSHSHSKIIIMIIIAHRHDERIFYVQKIGFSSVRVFAAKNFPHFSDVSIWYGKKSSDEKF